MSLTYYIRRQIDLLAISEFIHQIFSVAHSNRLAGSMLLLIMKNRLKLLVNRLLVIFGLSIVNSDAQKFWHDFEAERLKSAGERWSHPTISSEMRNYIFKNLYRSRSQLQQDLFVAFLLESNGAANLEFKNTTPRFFVEFGATDGISLSNTYLLENDFFWKGILSEPARYWHKALQSNRKCNIDYRCVHSTSGLSVNFKEAKLTELSTIQTFESIDLHSKSRVAGRNYEVGTVSLNDLLSGHGAPNKIDYLSVDTEGSEYLILEPLDFNEWQISVITVEHNYSSNREKIFSLLTSKGYKRVFTEVSDFDDWYIKSGSETKIEWSGSSQAN